MEKALMEQIATLIDRMDCFWLGFRMELLIAHTVQYIQILLLVFKTVCIMQ